MGVCIGVLKTFVVAQQDSGGFSSLRQVKWIKLEP